MVTGKAEVTYDVAFRVDGNSQIGMGHTMRCISIADQLRTRGLSIVFITSSHDTDGLLGEYGYDHIALENSYLDKNGELDRLISILEELQVKLVLVDSYETDTTYLQPLHNQFSVATFGKHTQYTASFDLLIDYNIQYDAAEYAKLQNNDRQLLLGAQYTPLRSQFVGITPSPLQDVVKNVLITTGGSDKYKITDALLENLSDDEFKDICFHVILGHLFDTNSLQDRYADHANIKLYSNVHDMAALYQQMDLAICAGGTTLYELLAVGVPAVVFSFSDNQNKGLYMRRYITHCGDIRHGNSVDVSPIIAAIREILPLQNRMEAREKGSGLIDGNGAIRIADHIETLVKEGKIDETV